MDNNKKIIKKLLIDIFTSEPYSAKRYNLVEKVKQLEKETGIYTNVYNLDTISKKITCDLMIKDKGLYDTIETFTIENIKVYEGE